MFRIRTYNHIAQIGLDTFNAQFTVGPEIDSPQAILCRSQDLHTIDIPPSVDVIARAGAGTNNIPIDAMTERGIPVLNTPGANANAVKELVITGMLLAARRICQAWSFVQEIDPMSDVHTLVEKQKKQFAGIELAGKTLGIIGLGHIGVQVANTACDLDMNVIGFDPAMTVQNAWKLNAQVNQASGVDEVLKSADFVSIHIPLLPATKHLINAEKIALLPNHAVLLNFARHGIVDDQAVIKAIHQQRLAYYVCDFPDTHLLNQPGVTCLPHLGASTAEAEENCAVMAAQQIQAFLSTGQIKHAVNFPDVKLAWNAGHRLAIVNSNVPNMVAQISQHVSQAGINIIDMINQSRDNIAYTLIDIDQTPTADLLSALQQVSGVIKVRHIER